MKKAKIFTINNCPHCTRAKHILERANIEYDEVFVPSVESNEYQNMISEVGKPVRTFPQIFVGSTYVGGCDNLTKMYKEKKLG